MSNKYQRELQRKGIVTSSRGSGTDQALDAAIRSIMKDPSYTPKPSHEHWKVKGNPEALTQKEDWFTVNNKNTG